MRTPEFKQALDASVYEGFMTSYQKVIAHSKQINGVKEDGVLDIIMPNLHPPVEVVMPLLPENDIQTAKSYACPPPPPEPPLSLTKRKKEMRELNIEELPPVPNMIRQFSNPVNYKWISFFFNLYSFGITKLLGRKSKCFEP